MVRVGKVVATHGLDGHVTITHITGNKNWLKKDTVLFLEINKGSFIPYFISDIKSATTEQLIISFEDLERVEDAKKIVSRHVYVDGAVLSEQKIDTPLLWIGFNIVDKRKGGLGTLEDVFQAGQQWLGKLMIDEKEVLIPLVEQTIIEANMKNRFLRVDMPEGLLEVYLD